MTGKDYAGAAFNVAVKDSAAATNDAVAQIVHSVGDILHYESRTAADAEATKLSRLSGPVTVQSPPPHAAVEVDAYLVAAPRQRKRTPEGSRDTGWTFDITPNQYGAIGEALLLADGTPALRHFVVEDLVSELSTMSVDDIRLDIVTTPDNMDLQPVATASTSQPQPWEPDAEIRVQLPERDVELHRYLLEVKTGNAGLQRRQRPSMEAASEYCDVVVAQVSIEDLPDAYTVSFERIGDRAPNLTRQADSPFRDGQVGLESFVDEE